MSRVSGAEFDKAAREDALRRARRALEAMSDDEDRAITAAAEADPDARPVDELIRKRGRPPLPQTKEKVSLRLDRDVLERFRSQGAGWQTRINDALRDAASIEGSSASGGGAPRSTKGGRFLEHRKQSRSARKKAG